jgi:hypothetical protein
MRAGGKRHPTAALFSGKKSVAHGTGDYVGPWAGLDGFGKPRPHRDSIPGPPSS